MNLETQVIQQGQQPNNNSQNAGNEIQNFFLDFLKTFQEEYEDVHTKQKIIGKKYENLGKIMIQDKTRTLEVDYNDLSAKNMEAAQEIVIGFIRYEPYLQKAVSEFISALQDNQTSDQNNENPRLTNTDDRFYVSIYNFSINPQKLRTLRLNMIGRLTTFKGTVTRSTDVRPELVSGVFRCQMCNNLSRQVEQEFKFTQPKFCTNQNCKNTTEWKLEPLSSIFTDLQKLRIQEDSSDIPPGGMPRSMDVVLRDTICDRVKPGDKVNVTGYLIVIPDIQSLTKPGEKNVLVSRTQGGMKGPNAIGTDGIQGLKQLGQRDLNYKLAFNGISVNQIQDRINSKQQQNQEPIDEDEEVHTQETILEQFTSDELERVNQMIQNKTLYADMAKSIAPSVSGSDQIKKGILLMLFGGIHKKTREGINLRGDLNVCIVGDPSTAKSQFLKFVANFLPRSVYTSGKASSAAGLTASVQRDAETGEYCVEAGALMLADHGVCCIDEFDKMNLADQVAIHEAMEQQTISIAKAGIQATLNARASILAAANPIFGRYDKSKTLKQNLDMSAPIMSRFDLFFVVLDQQGQQTDKIIANYILKLHQAGEDSLADDYKYSKEDLQLFLKFARFLKPTFTRESAKQLRECYQQLRLNDQNSTKSAYKITVRQLESLIRLSEALARVHGQSVITPEFVIEAQKLLSNSIIKIEKPDIEEEEEEDDFQHQGDQEQIAKMQLEKKQAEQQSKNKLKLTFDKYQAIVERIRQIMIEIQEEHDTLNDQNDKNEEWEYLHGATQAQIIEEYIKQNLEEIDVENQEQIDEIVKILKAVISRMHQRENILLEVNQQNQIDESERKFILSDNHQNLQ